MSEIARVAGLSRQGVYLHFPTRAALMVALVQEADRASGIERRGARALAIGDPREALESFLRLWLRYVGTIQPLATVLLAARRDDEAAFAAWEDRNSVLRQGLRRATDRLDAAGLLRDGLSPAAAADLAGAMTAVGVWEELVLDRDWSLRRVEDELAGAVVAALCV